MEKSLKEGHAQPHIVWNTRPHEMNKMKKRAENAFTVARWKFEESNGNLELVMQTAEAFGRGLFTEFIKEKPKNWTMKHWVESTTKEIFNPLGTKAKFTKITDNKIKSSVMVPTLLQEMKEQEISSLFTYGFMRGILRSAFPEGELLLGSTMTKDAPMTEFIFKIRATGEEKTERERVKTFFATTMKI